MSNSEQPVKVDPPMAMLAELSHLCPLKCLYCSNPLELSGKDVELSTKQWLKVLTEAEEMGVMQVHFSGGEPLVRKDLEVLVRHCSEIDLYVNLVSSGIGLTEARLNSLIEAGLTNFQFSMQADSKERANQICGVDVHEAKLNVLSMLSKTNLYLTLNLVLHALNIEHIEAMIEQLLRFNINKIELANCQYHGWARTNRDLLLPTREQIDIAYSQYLKLKVKALENNIELVWVYPDYYSVTPKPCMGGWAAKQLTISPSGVAMPCPGAYALSEMNFANIKEKSLEWIWYESKEFNAYRGYDWMKDPCRSCDKRFDDFGGCRCQAFALTGDATNTDPVCTYSSDNHIIKDAIVNRTNQPNSYKYREELKSK